MLDGAYDDRQRFIRGEPHRARSGFGWFALIFVALIFVVVGAQSAKVWPVAEHRLVKKCAA